MAPKAKDSRSRGTFLPILPEGGQIMPGQGGIHGKTGGFATRLSNWPRPCIVKADDK